MIRRKLRSVELTSDQAQLLPHDFVDTDVVADPLNQLIPISLFEKRIICCPEFQRLRRIKQLGFANLTYPAAEYSRFVHSLGACHQAKNLVDTINENLRNQSRYRQWRVYGRIQGAAPLYNDVAISPFERVVIAAAALLHDLSHGPFSHEIEGIPGSDNKPLIPDHDKAASNPALFLYFFDQAVSELAVCLARFNDIFAPALLEAANTSTPKAPPGDWRVAIKALRQHGTISDRGTVVVSKNSPLSPGAGSGDISRFRELPLLPVLIFEILLFEKQQEWLSPNEQSSLLDVKENGSEFGLDVATTWNATETICWQPLPGWFRAYRKDIIGDTICADLIDYVSRDGYHTGIVSTMDLKFLDRMLIARAVLPPIGGDGQPDLKPPPNRTAYKDIPVACEHVVFDVYDQKRGFIRQSVLTEILAYLQGRYLLCERVYIHRVVEAARSMLQTAISILCKIDRANQPGRRLLDVRDLHPLESRDVRSAAAPHGDESLLNWIQALPITEPETYRKNKSEIDEAIELATMLVERRVFREAIIYDGIHGFEHAGHLAGPIPTCRALEATFLTNARSRQALEQVLEKIDGVLRAAIKAQRWYVDSEDDLRIRGRKLSMVSVRKWGKRYKPPLVLVGRPLKETSAIHSALDIEPLLDCQDPPNIRKQLDAIKDSYEGLWKVYLFIHPVFHDRAFLEAHREIDKILGEFAAAGTGSRWRNAIDFEQLLGVPIDNPSFLAQQPVDARAEEWIETLEAAEVLPLHRHWNAAEILALLRPLTSRDADNLDKIQGYCISLADRSQAMTPTQRSATAVALGKLTTYQPKVPFILNRLGRYDADALIRRIEEIVPVNPPRDGEEAE